MTDPAMQPQPQPQLEPLDESWSTALAVVAHPDDLEYGTAAAIARWTSQGKRVVYCMATSGEAGIDGMHPSEAGPLREREELASAKIVGVDSVEFLRFADGVLEYGLPLRRAVAAAVRRHRPDVVLTGNYRMVWAQGALNQADHVALGRAVLDGVRDAGNRWVFTDLLDQGLQPWHVGTVLISASPHVTHGVDVSEHFETGLASLRAHEAYLRGLGEGPMSDPGEILESFGRQAGSRLGVRFAVAFEVIHF